MAPLPPGQPGVRAPGARPGARPPGRHRLRALALVAFSALSALGIADHGGVERLAGVDDALGPVLAACGLFAVCGFGLVRLLLPAELRRHELLWILPAGACAAGLELGVLGYLRVPFDASLALVGAANVALAVWALRRNGPPGRPPRLAAVAWPLWLALLLGCVALVPLFEMGRATVIGNGSDAHLAAGTAHLLIDHHPTEVAVEEPVDEVPLVWRSKPPIYYPLAAAATLSGVETWQALSPFMAVLLGLAALGFYLLAREALGAGLAGGAVAMSVVGLDRVVLHTTMHPYFNQLWGFMTLPFALVLAWWAVRSRTRGAIALLAGFLLVGAFAYPLAVPIPAMALVALLWPERGRLRGLRRLWRGTRSLVWIVPLALVLAVPARGVIEKMSSAVGVVADPTQSLASWGGDLVAFFAEHQFLAMPSTAALLVLAPLLLAGIVVELRRQPRPLAVAFAVVLVFGALAAAWFRPRDYGWYFHFKALAFTGPLAVLLFVLAASRLRRFAGPALGVLIVLAVAGARDEVFVAGDQMPLELPELRAVDERLPDGASVRLDARPPDQLWIAYFLAGQPLCSQRPLVNTSYPRVEVSRKADFIVADRRLGRPRDAVGTALWDGLRYSLYRMAPTVPGPDRCSQRMVQPFDAIGITGRARG